ncbi:MAG TPA: hypothetical protein VFE24_09380 [Pirellulales bacterium]|jgi:hypothetical protein|nr:hypothetical protein [Pirellulales bacterium]
MNVNESSQENRNELRNEATARPACPVCGGALIEIRAKLQCAVCHRICETCCEGGLG